MEKNVKKKNIIVILMCSIAAIVVVAGLLVLVFNKKEDEQKDPAPIYDPNDVKIDSFTYALLKLEVKDKNIVYSPLSIKYALSMLNEGAGGNTKKELDDLLGDLYLTKYENIDKVLSLANAVFIRDTYKKQVKDEYIDALEDKYNAELFYDSFESADKINGWIEEKTFDIIKNMLNDQQVQNPNLEMILVNALAIDMKWKSEFDTESTRGGNFTKADKNVVKAAMMSREGNSSDKYYLDDDYTALSMELKEYEGTVLEFVAIMPNNEDLKTMITADDMNSNLEKVLNGLHKTDKDKVLRINIPRFEYEFSISLVKDLMSLGVNDAFTMKADFSGISKSELLVGDVLHKANIKFSEKGIKAGAATVIMLYDKAMIEERKIERVVFDKPFMYIIRDTKTGEVWFTGAVFEPLLWEDVEDDYKYE